MKKVIPCFLMVMIAAVSMLALGCSSTELMVNPEASFPVEVSSDSPAFIFPISLHFGGSADKEKVNVALTAGVVSEFGASVVGGQQLYDFVGNLSWSLGENMRRNVNSGEWEMTGYAKETAEELAAKMEGIMNMLAELGLVEPGFNFKYIIVLHADGNTPRIAVPDTVSFTAFGGLYDIESNSILSYLETDVTLADDEITLLGQIPMEFNKIVKNLLAGELE